MSKHECPVVRVTIEPHPNADAIELALVGGYVSVVKKGQFKTGDLAVYLPEQSVLPDWLLKLLGFWDDMNAKGKLSGSAGNRIKAIKLRGILSQGVLLPCYALSETQIRVMNVDDTSILMQGEDAAEILGVTKYEPKVPVHMEGKVAGGDLDATLGYDFENIKKHPGLFEPGDQVIFTEKVHGTCLQVGLIPRNIWEGKPWAEKCPDVGTHGFKGIVTSKGQGAKGLMLDPTDSTNLYVESVRGMSLWDRLEGIRVQALGHPNDKPIFMFGELFGLGIQDLSYGAERAFVPFDIYAGTRTDGFFLKPTLFEQCCRIGQMQPAPVLYRGPFSQEVLDQWTTGDTVINPSIKQMREGVVVKAEDGSSHPRYGRRIAKSVSEQYLLRKNATEFN